MKPIRALFSHAVFVALLLVGLGIVGGLAVSTAASAPTGPGAADRDTAVPEQARPVEELPELRTRNSQTYRTESGALLARVSPVPVNFKDGDGDWRPIDNTLVAGSGGSHQNEAGAYTATLPEDLSEPVRFTHGGVWVEFSLDGADAAGAASENSKLYKQALPAVDVRYSAQPDGLQEDVILTSRDAATAFSYSLRTSVGLEGRESEDGGIEFVDGDGMVRFKFTPPFAYDAAGTVARGSAAPTLSLDGDAVTLRADRDWVTAEGRDFPVTIDPDIVYPANRATRFHGTTQECTLWSGASADTSFCNTAADKVGFDGSKKARTLLKFDLSSVPRTAQVVDSSLIAYVPAVSNTNSVETEVHRLTRSWTTAATWNRHDGTSTWSSAGGDFDSTVASKTWPDGNGVPNYIKWTGLRGLVQNWVDGTNTNHGFLLKQEGETTNNVVDIRSTSGDTTGNYWPSLDVWYWPRTGDYGLYTLDQQELNDRMTLGVNVANGNLLLQANDLSVAGVNGHDFNLGRAYNSGAVKDSHDMSPGWQLNTGQGVLLTSYDSADKTLVGPSGELVVFKKKSSGGFDAPQGVDARLEQGSFSAGGTTYTYKLTWNKSQEQWFFDSDGIRKRIEDRNDNVISVTYTNTSNWWWSPSSFTDTRGRSYSVSRNANEQVSQVTDNAYTGGRNVQYSYNANWDLATYTDANGKQTQYAYDSTSKLLTEITDPRGNKTKITYDSQKRVATVKRVTDAVANTGPTTTYDYPSGIDTNVCPNDAWGQTNVTDPNGQVTKYCFDKQLKVTRVRDARGKSRNRQWSPNGDVTQLTSAAGQASNFTFDSDRRPTESEQPAKTSGGTGLKSTNGYAHTGASPALGGNTDPRYHLPSTSTDTQGNQLTYGYDSKGNLTSTQNQLSSNNRIDIERRSDGQIDSIKEPNDQGGSTPTTDLVYSTDGKAHLTSVNRPAPLGDESFSWDAASRPDRLTDGRNNSAEYDFDKMDRLEMITYRDSSNTVIGSVTFVYDDNGNLTSRNDTGHGLTSYVFDKLNRLSTETFPGSRTNTYTYDAVGNLKTLQDAGGTTTYNYGPSNLLDSMQSPGDPAAVTFSYDDDNRRVLTTYPTSGGNRVKMTASYDNPGRLTGIKAEKVDPSTGNVLATLTDFAYDYGIQTGCGTAGTETNLRQQMTDKVPNPDKVTNYCYDQQNRLTKATESPGSTYEYAYDGNNNITRRTVSGTATSYGFNQANQLCWSVGGTQPDADCSPTPTGATTYSHDNTATNQSVGNLVGSGTGFVGQYNIRNQATSMTSLTGTNATAMASAGPNQFERHTVGSTTQTTGALGVNVDKTGTTSTYYRRDNNGQLVSLRQGTGTPHYYLFDGLGSTAALANTSGDKSRSYSYDPYGATTDNGGTSPANPWRYTGTYQDPTGFYKMGLRYYSPGLMRWTQQDALEGPTDFRQLNRYAYVAGNPINATDPSGAVVADTSCTKRASRQRGVVGTPATSCTASASGGGIDIGLSLREFAGLVVDSGLGAAACIPAGGPVGVAACRVLGAATVGGGLYDATDDNDQWWIGE
jgi:RHS repeat-associated protein